MTPHSSSHLMLIMSPEGHIVRRAWSLTSSPIHRLPDEMLSHIFHLCLHEDLDETNGQHISPRLFTKICKRWTHIALTNKSLWSKITMSLPLTPAQFIETNIRLIRSCPHFIDIHLDFRDPLWDWDEENHSFGVTEISTVIRALLPHIDRWHKLIVLTDTWAPIFCLMMTLGCVAVSAPVLNTISLSRCNAYFAAKGETFTPKCLEAPIKLFGGIHLEKLRHLSLVGVHIDWTGSYLANLQHLEFKYHASNVMPSVEQFMRILDSCPRLSALSIIGWGPRLDVAGPDGDGDTAPHVQSPRSTEMIVLEHLTRFAFGFVDVEYAVGLLSLFRFPALQELELEDVSSTISPFEECDSSAILKFLTGNRQSNDTEANGIQPLPLDRITSLELRGIDASRAAFVAFFGCTANLEHLVLSQTNDEAILSLSPPTTDGPDIPSIVCPCLRTLHCQNVDEEAVGDVIAARHVTDGRQMDVVIVAQNE